MADESTPGGIEGVLRFIAGLQFIGAAVCLAMAFTPPDGANDGWLLIGAVAAIVDGVLFCAIAAAIGFLRRIAKSTGTIARNTRSSEDRERETEVMRLTL